MKQILLVNTVTRSLRSNTEELILRRIFDVKIAKHGAARLSIVPATASIAERGRIFSVLKRQAAFKVIIKRILRLRDSQPRDRRCPFFRPTKLSRPVDQRRIGRSHDLFDKGLFVFHRHRQ